ncbi:sigma-54-dependent Fis family transcriptional regulator, partial [candidate division KSB1 bacterium]|nr:sigma-54-dependent Fis family transcriptional regulator [candidate division KSB1 bacterium]
IMTSGEVIEAADLPLKMQTTTSFNTSFPSGMTLHDLRDQVEKEYIIACLKSTGGNISHAARILGIERSNLHKKMRTLKIVSPGI